MQLQLNKISKYFGSKVILEDFSLELHQKDVLGIIGKNGEGKTTLLKILIGQLNVDKGEVLIEPRNLNIIYHEQFLDLEKYTNNEDLTIEAYIMSLYKQDLYNIYLQINSLVNKSDDKSINDLIKFQGKFIDSGGYEILSQIDDAITKVGLKNINSETKLITLSGGQKTKLQFIKFIINKPDILLLDEPTNHLDTESIKWLESYINNRDGITIIVSHDRSFLNNVTNKIIEIENTKSLLYGGNYDSFKEQKKVRIQKEELIYSSKMKQIKRLTQDAQEKEEWAKSTHNKFNSGCVAPIRKKAGKVSKTAQIIRNRIENQIKENMPDKPQRTNTNSKIKLELLSVNSSGQKVCELKDVSFSYANRIIFQNFNLEIFQKDRIAIIGNNGSGKSTLLKLIIGQLQPSNGLVSLGLGVDIGYYSQEHETLNQENILIDEFRKYSNMAEEDARTFLHQLLFKGNQVFQKISTLSQGEKSKLILAILLTKGANFLVLDEPTNHLDIASREVLEQSLKDYNGTILVVSHDDYFINNINIIKVIDLTQKNK